MGRQWIFYVLSLFLFIAGARLITPKTIIQKALRAWLVSLFFPFAELLSFIKNVERLNESPPTNSNGDQIVFSVPYGAIMLEVAVLALIVIPIARYIYLKRLPMDKS